MILSSPKIPFFWKSIFARRWILSVESAICYPAVTLVKSAIPDVPCEDNMKSNIDWRALELLSREKDSFVYVLQPLMKHRIHSEATTSELQENSARKAEDLVMFRKFWPEWIANLIEKIYQSGEKSNALK